MLSKTAFDKVIADAGGLNVFAELLGESAQTVSNWRGRGSGIPANKCKAFAAATGVSVRELREDWADYWPELATASVEG